MAVVRPAVIPESLAHARETLARLSGVTDDVQIDIVDGTLVPSTSWPYTKSPVSFAGLTDLAAEYRIELDLMVFEPERIVDACLDAGVRRFVIHVESTNALDTIITIIKERDGTVGLALNNETPFIDVITHIDRIDFVQCMGIKKIGVQGNPFDERVLLRIEELHKRYPGLAISVDGAVTLETLPKLRAAGATSFVAGSAIFGADDPIAAYKALVQCAS